MKENWLVKFYKWSPAKANIWMDSTLKYWFKCAIDGLVKGFICGVFGHIILTFIGLFSSKKD